MVWAVILVPTTICAQIAYAQALRSLLRDDIGHAQQLWSVASSLYALHTFSLAATFAYGIRAHYRNRRMQIVTIHPYVHLILLQCTVVFTGVQIFEAISPKLILPSGAAGIKLQIVLPLGVRFSALVVMGIILYLSLLMRRQPQTESSLNWVDNGAVQDQDKEEKAV